MAYEDLIGWANGPKCYTWQREAIRRIAISGEATDSLLDLFRNIIENEVGISNDIDAKTMEGYKDKILESDLSGSTPSSPRTVLNSIGPVRGFDRLADDQKPLRFASAGLTLVYGPNASGKSGYCRIARQLCRSVEEPELRGNIYLDEPSSVSEVELSYCVENEGEVEYTWKKGEKPPNSLSRISVFSTKSAGIYVNNGRTLEFLPYELSVLKKLTDATELIGASYRERRENLKKQIESMLPRGYNNGTRVSEKLRGLLSGENLSDLPRKDEIIALSKWGEKEKRRLEEIESEIRSNPKIQLQLYKAIKQNLEKIINEFVLLKSIIGSENISKVAASYNNKNNKSKLAKDVATILSKGMLISDTGSNAWREMFMHARTYAKKNVFPEGVEMSTADICVLCQQKLREDGKKNMAKFDNFISQQATEESREANKDFERLVDPLMKLSVMTSLEVENLLNSYVEAEKDKAHDVSEIVGAYEKINEILKSVRHAIENDQISKIETNDSLLENTKRIVSSIDEFVKRKMDSLEIVLESENEHIEALGGEKLELLDMFRLSQEVERILQFREKREETIRLGEAIEQCSKSSISSLVTSRRKALLTKELEAQLVTELKKFKVSHIPIKIADSSSGARSRLNIRLDTQQKDYKIGDILSEGEHRALALSCFFAELKEIGGRHGIIIDDPVSSLDNSRMRSVAKRIIEEAKTGRQVIVFTHSIPFFSMINQEADNSGIMPSIRTISSYHGKKFGIIDVEGAFSRSSRKIKDRIKDIKALIDELNEKGYDSGNFNWQWRTTEIYTYMRETWERIIEDCVLNETIKRFRPEIQTRRLAKISNLQEDYPIIEKGMTNCSRYSGHDLSEELPQVLPSMEEIIDDFQDLNKFYNDFVTR